MAKPTLEPGDVLDGFLMEGLIHRGGMARLWSVKKPGIDMPLLMKVPVLSEGQDPAAIVSFEMEQMIMPRITGFHVPQFVAAGDFAVHPYIVMERIPGKSLLMRLPDLPLPYGEVAEIGWKIATALDDIHRQHVIHLDVKPSNVLFRPSGEAVLIDFGLSHHLQLPDLMQEEFRLPYGTAPYMAPEQLLGARHDLRTDQFALGVLLYFFSTGIRPFGESERLGVMKRRLWEDPKPPRRLREDYPLWLQEIVLRCLEVEPAWRYPSMAQLAFELGNHDQIKLTARSERLKVELFLGAHEAALEPGHPGNIHTAHGRAASAIGAHHRRRHRHERRLEGDERRASRLSCPRVDLVALGAARLRECAETELHRHPGHHPRCRGPQQACEPACGAQGLGAALKARRGAHHVPRV